MSRTGIVYAVCDPREPEEVRYVGATVQTLKKRAQQHTTRNALGMRPSAPPRYTAWLDRLEAEDLMPQFRELRRGVPVGRLHVAEAAEWYRHVREGHDLLQDVGMLPEEALVHARLREIRLCRMFPSTCRMECMSSRLARGDWTTGYAFLKHYLTTVNTQRWR